MDVHVVDAGHDHPSAEIDHARMRTDEGCHLGLGPNRGKAPVLDRDRLGPTVLAVDGIDTAMAIDGVSRLGGNGDRSHGETREQD